MSNTIHRVDQPAASGLVFKAEYDLAEMTAALQVLERGFGFGERNCALVSGAKTSKGRCELRSECNVTGCGRFKAELCECMVEAPRKRARATWFVSLSCA
jgi:hypothetical protein